MVNQPYTEGAVRVVEVDPYPSQTGVNVDTKIAIRANTILDVMSIEPSVKLVKAEQITPKMLEADYEEIFNEAIRLDYIISSSNNKKEIILEPRGFLKIDTNYLLLVHGLKDVFGKPQLEPYYTFFSTGVEDIHKGTQLIFPADKTIIAQIPEFKWIRQETTEYILQISSSSSFEEILYNQTIRHSDEDVFDNTIQIIPDVILEEGTYYWRVKAVVGVWSKINAFYYQPIDGVPVTNEDVVYRDAAIMDYLSQNQIVEVTEDSISEYLTSPTETIFLKINRFLYPEDINDLALAKLSADDTETTQELDFDFTIIHTPEPEETYIIIHPIIESNQKK